MLTREEVDLNVSKIREDFPMFKNNPDMVYLDNAATSLKPKCVMDSMNEYYENYGVNIHRGVYNLSYLASTKYEQARENIASFINARADEVVFTKNVSEALNEICLMYSKKLGKDDIVLSSVLEHHSSILPWIVSSNERGFKLKYIPLDKDNRLTVKAIKENLNENVKVLVITYVSNVLGYINDIKEIVKIAHEHNCLVIVDAAQAVSHIKVDVRDLDCDFLAFSGHKVLGPTGIGVLYGKRALLKNMMPVYYGGDMNEEVFETRVDVKDAPFRFEVGTPMIAEVLGLSRAIDYVREIGFDKIKAHEDALINYLNERLKEVKGIEIYNNKLDSPVLSFNIKGVHPHDCASFYDDANICLRAGHHCAQLLTKHLGVNGTLRASFYIYNNFEDIDKFINKTKEIVKFFEEMR